MMLDGPEPHGVKPSSQRLTFAQTTDEGIVSLTKVNPAVRAQ
jgi:hypothetical protein